MRAAIKRGEEETGAFKLEFLHLFLTINAADGLFVFSYCYF